MNELLKRSGFQELDERSHLGLENVRPCVNEFSAFARVESVEPDNLLIVDSYYGQVYDQLPLGHHALYGATGDIPEYAIDTITNHGFLRVPFRRIPRRVVRSVTELIAVVKPLRDQFLARKIPFLYRGQNREHTLQRENAARELLYAEADAVEPSLLPSAMRKGVDLSQVAPLWHGIVAAFLNEERERALKQGRTEVAKNLLEDEIELGKTYFSQLFSTALAQHYGLPTTGLDLTNQLLPALFFAFTRFESGSDGLLQARRVKTDDELPVLYILTPPSSNSNAYSSYGPVEIRINRPRAQSAHFLHTGWGRSANDAARRILLALYLDFDPQGQINLPNATELFPERPNDSFGDYIERVRQRKLPHALAEYLEGLYWVVDVEST